MRPIKKILCPIDFSAFSHEALALAGEWAQRWQAELYPLHVMEPLTPATWEPLNEHISVETDEQARETQAAWQLGEAVKAYAPQGTPSHALVRVGDAAEEIVRAAESERADLIVMATHGRRNCLYFVSGSAVETIMLGSVTDRVLRSAPCPVLVVRPKQFRQCRGYAATAPAAAEPATAIAVV